MMGDCDEKKLNGNALPFLPFDIHRDNLYRIYKEKKNMAATDFAIVACR